jgi:hypothetical protein
MNSPANPAPTAARDHAALSLALAFLFAGLGYGLPFFLFRGSHPLNGPISPEVLNLYSLTAWMGLAHFAFAYHGQFSAFRVGRASRAPQFVLILIVGIIALILLRRQLSFDHFGFLIWIYFIPHFIKAELHFNQTVEPVSSAESRVVYWFPTLAFSYFTWILYFPSEPWTRLLLAVGVVTLAALNGGVKALENRTFSSYMLLGCFLVGEGLVWGMYRKYMDPHFQNGLYVFHIAIASFYHYFRSYNFAAHRLRQKSAPAISRTVANQYLITILMVNGLMVGLGTQFIWNESLPLVNLFFDVRFFTVWVGLHLVASDGFNWNRK